MNHYTAPRPHEESGRLMIGVPRDGAMGVIAVGNTVRHNQYGVVIETDRPPGSETLPPSTTDKQPAIRIDAFKLRERREQKKQLEQLSRALHGSVTRRLGNDEWGDFLDAEYPGWRETAEQGLVVPDVYVSRYIDFNGQPSDRVLSELMVRRRTDSNMHATFDYELPADVFSRRTADTLGTIDIGFTDKQKEGVTHQEVYVRSYDPEVLPIYHASKTTTGEDIVWKLRKVTDAKEASQVIDFANKIFDTKLTTPPPFRGDFDTFFK